MSQSVCTCGHPPAIHGWGRLLATGRTGELLRHAGRCLHAACSCAAYCEQPKPADGKTADYTDRGKGY